MSRISLRRRLPISTVLLTAVLTVLALAVPGVAAAAAPSAAVRYALTRPVCAQPSDPGAIRCFAERRVEVPAGTRGAHAYRPRTGASAGPAGGLTPQDLTTAYDLNPNLDRSTITVATVLWYDDPNALADLDAYDAYYHSIDPSFPAAETSTSFTKVDQKGGSSYPQADSGSAGEESLDIETIRGICHSCRILLVEATSPDDASLATAENTAVRLGASVVSNSWGGSETSPPSAALVAAFNHPGVAITASTGDSGWYDWDESRSLGDNPSQRQTPDYPSTDPHVISVGGTSLNLDAAGDRSSETVWDSDGPEGSGTYTGASGGGCSVLFSAPSWQAATPGYPGTCNGRRLAADVSADADPATGLDVYDSYGTLKPWQTVGGTSLASPLIAGMIALAGGSGGVAYPAQTIYANAASDPGSRYDVTSGGNGYCGGTTPSACAAATSNSTLSLYQNPNAYKGSLVDCSFAGSGNSVPATASDECNAASGYDGPSGVGTPNGLGLFTVAQPSASFGASVSRTTATLTGSGHESAAGASVSSYAWSFGDGQSVAGSSATVRHTYARAGSYLVTLTVTDTRGASGSYSARITLGVGPRVSFHGASSVRHGKSARYSVSGSTTSNTGARIVKVAWNWGDRHTSSGVSATHSWKKKGHYRVTVVVTDSSGVSTTTVRTVRVS